MKYIIILSLFFFGMSYGQTSNSSETWKIYKKGHLSAEYPSSWKLDTGGQFGAEFYVFSEKENEDDQFMENISLIIQDLKGAQVNLKDFADLSEQTVKIMITNYQNVESQEVKIQGQPFYHLSYTGEQGVLMLYFDQYFYINKDKIYIFTYTSEQDTHDDYEPVFVHLVESFKVK